jgi:hypothetical protein
MWTLHLVPFSFTHATYMEEEWNYLIPTLIIVWSLFFEIQYAIQYVFMSKA